MSKDPAFLFYANDYMGGTMGFTLEMHGGYLMTLIYQFNNGPFSEAVAHSLIGNVWLAIKSKFKTDGKVFWNEKMKKVMEQRAINSEHKRENAMKRWGKNDKALSKKKISIMQVHMQSRCTRVGDGNGNIRGGVGGIEIPVHLREVWPAWMEVCKTQRKPKTQYAQKLSLKKLIKMSEDQNTQVKIVELAIERGWLGLFPLHENSRFDQEPVRPERMEIPG